MLEAGSTYIVRGEAGTGKTFTGILCGEKLLQSKKPWQGALYLTYSKLAKWQIDNTRSKLEKEGSIEVNKSKHMCIQNFHSLWWDMICQNHAFLGISDEPYLSLQQELKQIADQNLEDIPIDDRKNIIPSFFLNNNYQYNKQTGHFNKLSQCLQGEALLYAKWGCENFGKRAEIFKGEDQFLVWAKNNIMERNLKGIFSHAETIYWANQLIQKHPNILNLFKAKYPILIIDEFQDTDIAQWEMVKLLAPETVIVMADMKQTIHRWRGASPQERLEEFKKYSANSGGFSEIIEYELVNKHRSLKVMSDNSNIDRAIISSDEPQNISMSKIRARWKCKNILKNFKDEFVGILCISNSLANDITNSLRQTQVNRKGDVFGYPMRCMRLGADNSPFEIARFLLHKILSIANEIDLLQSYVANELMWNVLPLPKSQLPKCGPRSRNTEPIKRWNDSEVLSKNICDNFGSGLLSLTAYFIKLESLYNCCCDRAILKCLDHVGKGVRKKGKTWDKFSIHEKKKVIDSLVMQYENSSAIHSNKFKKSVMTVHQSKGREYDVVVIPWFSTSKWGNKDSLVWDTSDTEIANIFHTACTRAKDKVIVIEPQGLEAKWPPN